MTKRVSLADVANSLGLSKTVVSLVVNDKADAHGISKKTQKRVMEKIKELNYQPNVLARGFRTGKTQTIGLIVSDISNRFYSRIARHIEDLAWQHGYGVVICSTDEKTEKERKQIRLLLDRRVDGLIISSSQDEAAFFNELKESGIPHVLIDRVFDQMQSSSVSVDNYGGARMATRHLLAQGVRDIALMVISPTHISTIRQRINGFLSAMQDAGNAVPEERILSVPFDTMEAAVKEYLQYFFQSGTMPQAIFTLNNNLTSLCIKYLRKLSISLPHEVMLIGFDDTEYFEYTQPTISVIEQPLEKISGEAFRVLLNQISLKQKASAENILLPVDIIIRESSVSGNSSFTPIH